MATDFLDEESKIWKVFKSGSGKRNHKAAEALVQNRQKQVRCPAKQSELTE